MNGVTSHPHGGQSSARAEAEDGAAAEAGPADVSRKKGPWSVAEQAAKQAVQAAEQAAERAESAALEAE